MRDYLHSNITSKLKFANALCAKIACHPFTLSAIIYIFNHMSLESTPTYIVITTEINLSLFPTSVSVSDNNFIVVTYGNFTIIIPVQYIHIFISYVVIYHLTYAL